jgi:putative transposase
MAAWSTCGAVDAEGEVLNVLVQSKRDQRAALMLMRKLLKKYGCARSIDHR